GHSDRQGSEEMNWKLSLERARTVNRILVERGVPETLIETTSHGEGNPRIPTADEVSEPRNRRVEVTVR
ncbi:MAG: OmpA family protein, partial [Thermodesulfobacteriota bacterium]